MGRGPSPIFSPKSGMAFPITLEHYNPSHSSKKLINCYSSTHTLANTDLYRSLSVLSLLSIWLSYWCLTCYGPVMCYMCCRTGTCWKLAILLSRTFLNCNFVTFNTFLYNKYKIKQITVYTLGGGCYPQRLTLIVKMHGIQQQVL